MPRFADFAGFAGVVKITRLNTCEFYHDELYGNEVIFVLNFVSSNSTSTAVEATEQFILLHTKYICDFSGLTNFSPKLCILEGNI